MPGSSEKEGLGNSASKSSSVITQESESSKTYKLPGNSGISQPKLNPLQKSALFLSYIFKITKVATVEILLDAVVLASPVFIPSETNRIG